MNTRRFSFYHTGDPSVGIEADEIIVEVPSWCFSKENDPDGEQLAWFKSELAATLSNLFDFETCILELTDDDRTSVL